MRYYLRSLINRLNLVGLSAYMAIPALAAWCARVLSEVIDNGSRHTVLCIGRPIFNEDVHALAEYGGALNYVIVPKSAFIRIFNRFLPDLIHEHARYHEINGFDKGKQRYREFLYRFMAHLVHSLGIDAMMTANYNYSWQQELVVAARERKIPVVVLFKEGISPLYVEGDSPQAAYRQLVRNYTNNRLIADVLLVYNERIARAFLQEDIPGVFDEMLEVVGIPRFDRYFRICPPGENILFFSFNFEDKARHLGLSDEESIQYAEKTADFHAEVIRYAMAHPERKVVVKTKNHVKYLHYVERIAHQMGADRVAPNLIMTNQGDVFDLLENAYAVIGYNSTALLEAYAAGRLVLAADFRWGRVKDYFDEHPDVPHYVSSCKDIEHVLADAPCSRPVDDPELHQMLKERIYLPDGRASRRAETAIQRIVDRRDTGMH